MMKLHNNFGQVSDCMPGSVRPLSYADSGIAIGLNWPTSYVLWDLETTGLNHLTGHIVEIGAVVVENGEVKQTYQWILDNEVEIPAEAAAIHGITNELVAAEGRDPKDCIEEFLGVLAPGMQPHITHNGYRFDIPWMVHHACNILGLTIEETDDLRKKLHENMIDTAAMVKGAKLGLRREWNETQQQYAARVMDIIAKGVKYNVTLCCEEMGIDMTGVQTHRAVADILLTNEIYKRLVNPIFHAN